VTSPAAPPFQIVVLLTLVCSPVEVPWNRGSGELATCQRDFWPMPTVRKKPATLVAGRPLFRAADAGPPWATPQIVHFSIALLLSALMRAAWHAITPVMALCSLIGFGGVVYMAVAGIRLGKQKTYGPDRDDRVFHFLLPLLACLVLALSAVATYLRVDGALFGIAAPTLLLVFIVYTTAGTAFLIWPSSEGPISRSKTMSQTTGLRGRSLVASNGHPPGFFSLPAPDASPPET